MKTSRACRDFNSFLFHSATLKSKLNKTRQQGNRWGHQNVVIVGVGCQHKKASLSSISGEISSPLAASSKSSSTPPTNLSQTKSCLSHIQLMPSSSMGPFVGEATAGLASFELVGLDCRDMLAAEISKEACIRKYLGTIKYLANL